MASSSSLSLACAWCDLNLDSCICAPSSSSSHPSSSHPSSSKSLSSSSSIASPSSSDSTSSSFILSPRSFPALPSKPRRLTETPLSIRKTLSLFHASLKGQFSIKSKLGSVDLVKEPTFPLPKPGLAFSEAVKRPPPIKNPTLDFPTAVSPASREQVNIFSSNLNAPKQRVGWDRIFQRLRRRCIKCGEKGHRADLSKF